MNIQVMSKRMVEDEQFYLNWVKQPHILISIGPRTAKPAEHPLCKGVLFLEFEDFDDLKVAAKYDMRLIDPADGDLILNFVKGRLGVIDCIVCQCQAGISRSAGAAAALSLILNGEDQEFFNSYLPNMLVYRTILKAFERLNEGERQFLSGATELPEEHSSWRERLSETESMDDLFT